MESMTTLVVVPCGASKIWSVRPGTGRVAAQEAYIGTPFKVNREYAERVGDAWVILSAKYGFLRPEHELDGPYEVTFKKKKSGPISSAVLAQQVQEMHLDHFEEVVGLGGKEYRLAIEQAFAGHPGLRFPFAGLPLGYALQATKRASAGL